MILLVRFQDSHAVNQGHAFHVEARESGATSGTTKVVLAETANRDKQSRQRIVKAIESLISDSGGNISIRALDKFH